MNQWPAWVRWVLLPFAIALAFAAAELLYPILVTINEIIAALMTLGFMPWLGTAFGIVVGASLRGALPCFVAGYVAPSRKLGVSVSVAVLVLAVNLAAIIIPLVEGIGRPVGFWAEAITCLVLGAFASVQASRDVAERVGLQDGARRAAPGGEPDLAGVQANRARSVCEGVAVAVMQRAIFDLLEEMDGPEASGLGAGLVQYCLGAPVPPAVQGRLEPGAIEMLAGNYLGSHRDVYEVIVQCARWIEKLSELGTPFELDASRATSFLAEFDEQEGGLWPIDEVRKGALRMMSSLPRAMRTEIPLA